MENYKRLLRFVKPYWRQLFMAMTFMGLFSACTAALAYLMKPAIDEVFIKKNTQMLKIIPFAIIGVVIIKGIADYLQAYFMTFVGLSVIRNIRDKLYSHLQSLSISFFSKTPTGILISRITNDVNLVQGSVSNAVTGLIKDSVTILGLTAVVFYRDWKLGLIAFIIFPIAIIPIKEFGKRLRKFSRKGLQRMGSLTTFLHETITGNRIVKAFTMEEYEKRRFAEENERYFKIFLKRVKIRALSHPLMELLGGIGIAVIIWVGGYSVVRGDVTPGTFFSFMNAI